jgi:hypothetical protein
MSSANWTEHKTSAGRTYYYDSTSNRSVWDKPIGFGHAHHIRPTLEKCLDESPHVAGLFNALLRHCPNRLPDVSSLPTKHVLCQGGRGGAFCCASQRIYICSHPWVSCREVAYELSHALNVCRNLVNCTANGMQVDGLDCGYMGPPDVACSEYANRKSNHGCF